MPRGKTWLAKEVDKAAAMAERGLGYGAIALHFPGRSPGAVRCALRYRTNWKPHARPLPKKAKKPTRSEIFRERLLDYFASVANDTGKNMAEVQAMLLGAEPARRETDRERFLKTASAERLAA